MSKKMNVGKRLAYMLRTAVVEAQAVEAGRHPHIKLDMGFWGNVSGTKCLACLGGVYAILGMGKPALGSRRGEEVCDEERILNDLRQGSTAYAVRILDVGYLPPEVEQAYADLVSKGWDNSLRRASWSTYLKGADILEHGVR